MFGTPTKKYPGHWYRIHTPTEHIRVNNASAALRLDEARPIGFSTTQASAGVDNDTRPSQFP